MPVLDEDVQPGAAGHAEAHRIIHARLNAALEGGDSAGGALLLPAGGAVPSGAVPNLVVRRGEPLWFGIARDGGYLTSLDGVSWTRRGAIFELSDTGAVGTDVACGGGLLVAVGRHGRIATSEDGGATWNQQESTTGEALVGVAYGDGLWVAVGDAGVILTSPDGITWTHRESGFGQGDRDYMIGVAYGGGLWVAGGEGARLTTSSDGITWTVRGSNSWNDEYDYAPDVDCVAYGGGLWVAAGDGGALSTSPDGVTWTPRDSGLAPNDYIYDIAHGDGLWVAGAHYGHVITSPDGITWTVLDDLFGEDAVDNVVYGGGRWLLGYNNWLPSPYLAISENGFSWTVVQHDLDSPLHSIGFAPPSAAWSLWDGENEETLPLGGGDDGHPGSGADSLALGDASTADGDYSIAIGPLAKSQHESAIALGVRAETDKDHQAVISARELRVADYSDGAPVGPSVLALQSDSGSHAIGVTDSGQLTVGGVPIEVGGESVLTLGRDDSIPPGTGPTLVRRTSRILVVLSRDSSSSLIYSHDGVSWHKQASQYGTNPTIAEHDGTWVRASNSGVRAYIDSSFDGLTWTRRFEMDGWANGIAYENGLWLVAGDGGMAISRDGIEWQLRPHGVNADRPGYGPAHIAYGKGTWVVACYDGSTVLTSTDGTTWAAHDAGVEDLYGIAYGNGRWVAATGGIATSTDGVNWEPLPDPDDFMYSVAYLNGLFVMTGGGIHTSMDGLNWVRASFAGDDSFWGEYIAFGDGHWMVIGDHPVSSPDGINWTAQPPGSHWPEVVGHHFDKWIVPGYDRTIQVSEDGLNWVTLLPEGEVIGYYYHYSTLAEGPGPTTWSAWNGRTETPLNSEGGALILDTREAIPPSTPPTLVAREQPRLMLSGDHHGRVHTSVHGDLWTAALLEDPGYFSHEPIRVAYSNGLWVAGSESGKLLTSRDGATWVNQAPGLDGAGIRGVAYENERWVATGSNGKLATSSDGSAWTVADPGGLSDELRLPVGGDGKWVVVVGSEGALTSDDGLRWQYRGKITANRRVVSMAYGDGTFVCAINDSYFGVSTDGGHNWFLTNAPTPSNYGFKSIAYGDGKWMAVGSHYVAELMRNRAHIATSPDGVNWTAVEVDTSFTAPDVHISYYEGIWYGVNSRYGVAGVTNSLCTSEDGVNWKLQINRLGDSSSDHSIVHSPAARSFSFWDGKTEVGVASIGDLAATEQRTVEAGMVVIRHGGDPDVPRPAAGAVYWIGSAEPVNAVDSDQWHKESA